MLIWIIDTRTRLVHGISVPTHQMGRGGNVIGLRHENDAMGAPQPGFAYTASKALEKEQKLKAKLL
ncbi:MAG: hypothetical protein ACLP59_15040 [Bryobacteraceae bacterium]